MTLDSAMDFKIIITVALEIFVFYIAFLTLLFLSVNTVRNPSRSVLGYKTMLSVTTLFFLVLIWERLTVQERSSSTKNYLIVSAWLILVLLMGTCATFHECFPKANDEDVQSINAAWKQLEYKRMRECAFMGYACGVGFLVVCALLTLEWQWESDTDIF